MSFSGSDGSPIIDAKAIRRMVRRWGAANFQLYPWRAEANAWLALAAEVMLQRTRATKVAEVYGDFCREFPTPGTLAGSTEAELFAVVAGLGLQWRSRLLFQLARELTRRGAVPTDEKQLLKLPGVGPYAAAAFLSLHAHRRAVIIDANIVRWLCRMTGREMDGETRRKPWIGRLADELTPTAKFREYNYAALDFTMLICGRRPRCEVCPFAKSHCAYAADIEL